MSETQKSEFGVVYTGASILALLADFANGIFATVFAGVIIQIDILWWHFLIGILFAVLPDMDAWPQLIIRGTVSAASANNLKDHRELLHYPALFLLCGIAFVLVYPFFGWMFLLGTMLHFLNDLYGTGWGIPILWPLLTRRYKLLGRRVNRLKQTLVEDGDWERLPEDERRLRLIVSWKKDELAKYISLWGMDEWITPYYLRLNWVSGTEYTVFIIALLLLATTLLY